MTFTTPCFVRVENTERRKELVKWCTEIGYDSPQEPIEIIAGSIVVSVAQMALVMYEGDVAQLRFYIDCGTNIELFKALASRNDENASEQWLVNDLGIWIKCAADLFGYTKGEDNVTHFRKATVEEIVEHFKNKEA